MKGNQTIVGKPGGRASAAKTPTPRRRHRLVTVLIGIAALSLTVCLARVAGDRQSPAVPAPTSETAVVATIDGTAVPVREFDLFLGQERAATFAYYQRRSAVLGGSKFWTTPVDGTTPAQHLRALALTDVTRVVVQQAWARQLGLFVDPSYAAFVTRWRNENARRARAVQKHEVIYGPQQYTEQDYFDVFEAQLSEKLKETLVVVGQLKTPNDELYAYYQSHMADFTATSAGTSVSQPETQTSPTAPAFEAVLDQVRRAYIDDRYLTALATRGAAAHIRTFPDVLDQTDVS